MRRAIAMSIVLALSLLSVMLSGCAQAGQEITDQAVANGSVNETIGIINQTAVPVAPKSTLSVVMVVAEGANSSGRAPFLPSFAGGCYDSVNRIVSCAIYQDGKMLSENIMTNNIYSFENFMAAGDHTVELRGANSKGENASQTAVFTVLDTVDLYFNPLPQGADPAYMNAVRDAYAYWKQKNGINVREVRSPTPDSVIVGWSVGNIIMGDGGLAAGIGGRNILNISLGNNNCYGNFSWYTAPSIFRIARHELGHVLVWGGGHPQYFDPVMNTSDPMTGAKWKVAADTTVKMGPRVIWPFGICSEMNITTYHYNITSDRPVNIKVVPSIDEYNKLVAGKPWTWYVPCVFDSVTSVEFACVVPSTSYLLVMNDVSSSSEANVRIVMWEDDCVGECYGRY